MMKPVICAIKPVVGECIWSTKIMAALEQMAEDYLDKNNTIVLSHRTDSAMVDVLEMLH